VLLLVLELLLLQWRSLLLLLLTECVLPVAGLMPQPTGDLAH
jgi:hypothetical protein